MDMVLKKSQRYCPFKARFSIPECGGHPGPERAGDGDLPGHPQR